VVHTQDGYAAWGRLGKRALLSADGRTWRAVELPAAMQLSYAAGRLIGLASGNDDLTADVWTSADGASWDSEPFGPDVITGMLNRARVVETKFGLFLYGLAAVRDDTAVWVSFRSADQGQTWQPFTLPTGLSAYSVVTGPLGVYVGEPMCGNDVNGGCTGAIGWTPPLWRSLDGDSWEFVGQAAFPEIGLYDGSFVLDVPTCYEPGFPSGWPCTTSVGLGTPVRISADGKTWQTLASFPADRAALTNRGLGDFSIAALGTAGISAIRSRLDGTEAPLVWFGRARPSDTSALAFPGPDTTATQPGFNLTIAPGLTPVMHPDDVENRMRELVEKNENLLGHVLADYRTISIEATTGAQALAEFGVASEGDTNFTAESTIWVLRAQGTFVSNWGAFAAREPVTATTGYLLVNDFDGKTVGYGFPLPDAPVSSGQLRAGSPISPDASPDRT
jgi:hypothetical protein